MKKTIMAFLKRAIPATYQPGLKAVYIRLYYFGLKFRCPFCKSRLKTMIPFGYNFPVLKEKEIVGGYRREESACPICGSYDRERLLYLYLLNKTDVFRKPQKLLHVAPEKRVRDILASKPYIEYLTADLFSEHVMLQMDLTDIHFHDQSFDAIICCHVLEHIIEDRKAMAELYRVLKPGGWAILQVPISLKLEKTYEDFSITTEQGREEAFGQNDHVRIYAKDYESRLVHAGFNVKIFRWPEESGNFGGRRNKFNLCEDECVYRVDKPCA
jgi:predicted SAM-dependent methyltransferase